MKFINIYDTQKINLFLLKEQVGYFIVLQLFFFLKLLVPDCKIIYISHSVELEIRKKYSNKLIYYLTKFLENLVFRISNYSTTVSIKEKNKILKLYNKNTKIYPNAISINEKNIKKKEHTYI